MGEGPLSEPPGRHARLTDDQGRRLQDSITFVAVAAGAGLGAVVGGVAGAQAPSILGRAAADGWTARGAIVGALAGIVLGAFHGRRTALLTLLVLEVHLGDGDPPPERPWRDWS